MSLEDRHPPAAVSAMVERYYSFERVDSILGRRLQSEIYGSTGPNVSRELREILLKQALRLHLSREERLGLFCHRMQFDGGEGLSAGSKHYYGKHPSELSDLETAGLIAADLRPRFSSPFTHRGRFEADRREVLARVGTHTP